MFFFVKKIVQSCSKGCFFDQYAARDIVGIQTSSSSLMTTEYCVNYCSNLNYAYAGLQNGDTCFCGNSYGNYGAASLSDCNVVCTGSTLDSTQLCGNWERNNVYDVACSSRERKINFYFYDLFLLTKFSTSINFNK